MATKRITTRVLAGLTLVSGLCAGKAAAQGTPESLLARKPVMAGVQVTTPAGAELAACKAEQMAWPKTGNATPTGVVVKDAQGRLVRQFVDTTGRNNPNIVSFYLNGTESYRELDTNGDGKPDQFRWLGANGSKWGSDANQDGVVDQWHVLSPEELSQELFQVIVNQDGNRLAALIPTEAELKAAGLPASEVAKITQRTAGVGKKVGETIKALQLTPGAKWVHVEVGVPQTTPGDAVGSPADIVVHKSVTVLFDKGDGKTADVFQTGELIQIGRTWKLIDGPAPGAAPVGGTDTDTPVVPDTLQPLVAKLGQAKTPAERAAVLEEITGKTQGAQQTPWFSQLIETYATMAESGDAAAMGRLKQWHDQTVKLAPGSANAAFVAFRLVNAEYTTKLNGAKPDEFGKIQTWWRESLEGYIKAYPTAEDTPDAIIRLAVAFEFAGKDGEGQAKTWYEHLVKNFPKDQLAAKAQGAIKRLTCEGTPFQLAGTKLGNGGQFDMGAVNGKAVVVYYWASWGRDAAAELKMLAELAKTFGPKGLEIVTVSLDAEPGKAVAALTEAQVPGHHLFAAGGLDGSPLATAYGIQMAPHVFLIGKDGKVVSKNAQTGPVLKDEVEKLVK
jgi:hypothetical protein